MSQPNDFSLQGRKILVTGGSRGLGLGIVEALVAKQATTTVLAREKEALLKVRERLGVEIVSGDVTESGFAESTLRNLQPEVVILNAGAIPPMGSIDKISWEDFTFVWNQDVKAGLLWIQAALRIPLAPGSRVILASSGAAVAGSPLSGGYAGAKRMLWMMAGYANGISDSQKLGIKFQAVVPRQLFADTRVGEAGANDYARRRGITPAEIYAGFPNPLSPRRYGDQIAELLTDPKWANGTAFSMSGDQGITSLDV